MSQTEIDSKNAKFWDELCGTNLARSLGITEPTPESLRRFDEAYLSFYPYLDRYVTTETLVGKRVLEIGLGYGTLGQLLAARGCRYYGLDIAPNPVAMMKHRLAYLGRDASDRIQVGSALEIPCKDASFDYVYSVGCLHHTGNLDRAISEVHRVLGRGGKAIVMLYNRHSFRRLVKLPVLSLRGLVSSLSGLLGYRTRTNLAQRVRALYDINTKGDPAPHTDYVSRGQVRQLFRDFRDVRIESQNFDSLVFLPGRLVIPREKLLGNVARVAGLDLYIQAYK